MNKLRQCSIPLFLLSLCLGGSIKVSGARHVTGSGSGPAPEENANHTGAGSLPLPVTCHLPQTPDKRHERERAYAREQFTKNFRDLQLLAIELLQDHEATKLTPGKLAKIARSINKSSRTLRSLIALGEMASEVEINKEIDTAREFDESIRKLATLISDFARNPVHKSSKVFNTDDAERAQTDLLTIINLSKTLENKSKGYARSNPHPLLK